MSTSLTTRVLPAIPDRAVLPAFSAAITQAIWLIGAGRAPAESTKIEARNLLASGAGMLGNAKPAQVQNWLLRINLATSQPIAPADFDIRAAVIVDALVTFPAAVFTAETAREASMRFKWFPGAQEVAEFIAPHARRIRSFEADLRRVAYCALVEEPPRPEPTEAEREAVAASVASITRRWNGEAQEPARTVDEQIAAVRSASS